ncbi:MAG TPA: 3-hydroxyacyl-CoA dehydrogenase NAD-binding domain-containing protein [Pseudonocardia sp.]|nr:3-hydroxyacyl-CoA dehydrogenase NAD-binding domain-containing protein [Pseudonocardia sp.]
MTRVAVIGTGVIGASWAAHFLGRGLDVVASDPAPDAEARLREAVAAIGDAPAERLTFTADSGEAAAAADFVQENAPERAELKHALLATLDAAARPGVVLASSSSTLLPSDLARACARHPERVVVGHPFHPPHLVPLVEVVPGEATAEAAVEAAMAFYTAVGKKPVRLRRELPGHLANRLQAALWREAYSLVQSGAASVADVDTAIAHGPGLRWALLGPLATQHLSGGAGGLAHVLAHLGPPTEAIWRDLGEPEMTPELVADLVAGVEEELGGADPAALAALAARRDAALRVVLAAKADLP